MEDQGKARDEGIERAARSNAVWQLNAVQALHRVARRQLSLTSDDVWADLQRWGIHPPSEPRAMGSVMRHGTSEGWVQRTEKTLISPDPSRPNHRRPQRVYLSLILAESPDTQVPEPAPVSVAPSAPQGTPAPMFETVEEPRQPALRASDYVCGEVPTVKGRKVPCLTPLTHIDATLFETRYVRGYCPACKRRVDGSLSRQGAHAVGWGSRGEPVSKTTKPRAYRKRKTG